jgi:Uma2 family endonuclease
MELLIDSVVETELSDYEIERNKPMPSKNHSMIQSKIAFELTLRYRKEYDILPEISLDTPGKGTVPDLAIYSKMNLDVRHDEIKLSEPPLITIEILSPEQKLQDLIDKTYRYFDFGVKSCWIVLPSLKTVMVYSDVDTFEYIRSDKTLIDPNWGFELPLKDIFV